MFGFPRQTFCILSFRTISRNFWPLLWGRLFGFGDSRRGGALHRLTMNCILLEAQLQGNVPHLARKVWPNDILEFVLIEA